jgi:hypothetical protein
MFFFQYYTRPLNLKVSHFSGKSEVATKKKHFSFCPKYAVQVHRMWRLNIPRANIYYVQTGTRVSIDIGKPSLALSKRQKNMQ